MKKRIVALLLCLSVWLGVCGCSLVPDPQESLAGHFEKFDTNFFLWTDDTTTAFQSLFQAQPKLQMYLNKVTSESGWFGTRLRLEYIHQDVPQSDIDVAESEADIADLLSGRMAKGVTRGFILLKDQNGKEPDIAACRDAVTEKNYLHTMGMSAMECTFVTNTFTKDTLMEYTVEYMEDTEIVLAGRELVEKKVKVLADSLWLKDAEQRTIVRSIHDYIIKNSRYDSEGTSDFIDHTPYGIFAKGIGVCDGYTYAAKLLLDAAGIENYTVDGTALGEDHTWNIVKLGDRYFHMDVTWDDPVNDLGRDMLLYDYFLIDDEEIREDHAWDPASVPACK